MVFETTPTAVEDELASPNLKPLLDCVKTLPCSTAECVRGFSAMNSQSIESVVKSCIVFDVYKT